MSGGMRQRQEIPTHLEVEDRVLFGLTLRQCVWLLLGVAAGYMVYVQSGRLPWPGTGSRAADEHLPLILQIVLGLAPLLCALVVALLQPAGRSLEDWFFASARYLTLPKRCVARSPTAVPAVTVEPYVHDEGMLGGETDESSQGTLVIATSAVIAVTAVSADQWEHISHANNG